jgi:uncharacterized protein (TIGR02118 family)
MFKVIVMIARKAGLSREDFMHHYETTHVPLVHRLVPQLVEYRRNYIDPDDMMAMPGAAATDFDSVTEMWFADRAGYEAMSAINADPVAGALLAEDAALFLDADKTRMFVVGEYGDVA